jgi:tetratricopeptide (TPR) repeat protein
MLGLIATDAGWRDEAESWLTKGIATLEPIALGSDESMTTLIYAYQNRGLNYMLKGDYDPAAADYEKAKAMLVSRGLEDSAAYASVMANYGVMRRYQGHYAEAAQIFREAIASRLRYQTLSYPDVVSLHVNLASALIGLKDYAGVLDTVDAVLSAELTHQGYGSTSIAQLHVRRVQAQQLSGLTSSLADIEKAREGLEVLRRELRPRTPMSVAGAMAISLAVWESGALSGETLAAHCQEMRLLVAEQAEVKRGNPRLTEFGERLRAHLASCDDATLSSAQ